MNPSGLKSPSNQFDSITVRTALPRPGSPSFFFERKATNVVAERGDIQTLS